MSSSSASTGGPEGPVIVCKSAAEFEEHVKKAAESKKLVVVDFTAAWCGPCKFIAPVFAELAKTTAHVVFLKVDVDELKDVAEKYRVEAMPTFLFIKEGNEIERVVGARKADLEAKVQQHGAYVVA